MVDLTTAPTGTYRLQLRPEFGFDDATAVLPYLHDLGVSHVYLSPILQASPGSTHGYDGEGIGKGIEWGGYGPSLEALEGEIHING